MTNRAEREVMGLAVTTNAALVAYTLGRGDLTDDDSVIAAIAATRSLGLIVDDTLHTLVHQARAEGHTWAEIGDLLHVTRQAAFQRFGSAPSAEPDEADVTPVADAEERAARLFLDFVEQRWERVPADFSTRMRDAVSPELLKSVWAKMDRGYGAFVGLGQAHVSLRHGYTVVETALGFERGDMKGQVSFNLDDEVAGLFFLPIDSP